MQKQYETVPSADLRKNPAEAMNKADIEPVIITTGTTPRTIMVSFEQWNVAATRLAYLERLLLGDRASANIEAGNFHTQEDVDRILDA